MKRKLDFALAIMGFCLFLVAMSLPSGGSKVLLVCLGILLFLVGTYDFLVKSGILPDFRDKIHKSKGNIISGLALLNDENQVIATWDLYEKTSLVIGLDVGENQVDVNLAESVYASTLDVEHAVINYAGGQWFVEDLDSENGVAVMKCDGQKYQLTALKPCLIEKGDILFVSLVKLKLT